MWLRWLKSEMSWNENIIINKGTAHKPYHFSVVFLRASQRQQFLQKNEMGGWGGEGGHHSPDSYFLHVSLRINMLIFCTACEEKLLHCAVSIFFLLFWFEQTHNYSKREISYMSVSSRSYKCALCATMQLFISWKIFNLWRRSAANASLH